MLRRKVDSDVLCFVKERITSINLTVRLLNGFIKVKKDAILTTPGD